MGAGIPPNLHDLLSGSDLEPEILDLVRACDQVLVDNKMPFFPAYTDHGSEHVQAVLSAAEGLIPTSVWESGQLEAVDAAVLVGAILLHDLAMHIREPGFIALVSGSTDFQPQPWFNQDHARRPADREWPEAWQAFRKQARYLSLSERERLFGPLKNDVPEIAFGDADRHPENWTENDRLLVGEFLRRHHPRLAHEIALYGLPGIDSSEFPVLKETLSSLANAIGVTARSHGEELRVPAAYLEHLSKGNLRPNGAVQLYLMAVLRVADYFQLQRERASPLLLHLREPQSPVSVAEWARHQAIEGISWKNKDPDAAMIEVTPDHDLRTHLQLAELIGDLQRELDVTAAVLSETYGSTELDLLQLSLKRVKTNLFDVSLHERLSFVPRRARLRSAEDLFRLVVSDLYGNQPAVAGRELLQNAVDAVREKDRWLTTHSPVSGEVEKRDLPADVLVEIREVDASSGELRVVDNGIGMTPSTIIDSFLTAGASFRGVGVEEEGADPLEAIKWMKAGRFGVGCFASFLLGSRLSVVTRHISESRGVAFTAEINEDLVQLDWVEDVPVGTEIVIPFSYASLPNAYGQEENWQKSRHLIRQISRFYEMARPTVWYRIQALDSEVHDLNAVAEIPTPGRRLPDDWRSVPSSGFDSVLWQVPPNAISLEGFSPSRSRWCRVAHNGIAIEKVDEFTQRAYRWRDPLTEDLFGRPSLAVFDAGERLGITLNRYELTDKVLPFEEQLLESIGSDLVGWALACGSGSHPLAGRWGLRPLFARKHWLPLLPALVDRYVDRDLCVVWALEPEAPSLWELVTGRIPGGYWRQLPFRVALEPKEIYGSGRESRSTRGITETEVIQSVDLLGSLLRRSPVASLFSREDGSVRHLSWKDEDLLQLLTGLVDDVRSEGEGQILGITVFRCSEEKEEPREEPIARPWVATVGGALERSAAARRARAEAETASDKKLRILVNKWSRLRESWYG